MTVYSAAIGGALAQSPPAVDWSGFYIGGLVGGTTSQAKVQTTVGTTQYLDETDAAQINRAANSDLDQWRPAGGVVGGYGKQFGNVVVGVEASANTLFLNDEHTVTEIYQTVPTARYILKQSITADWMATVRPRLGWAQDNWLAYITGGLAATRLKLETKFTDNAFSGFSQSSESKLVAGWSLGLGGEYALGGDWSLRGDYLYTRFGPMRSSSVTTSTNNSGGSLLHTAELETHGMMIGLIHRFKGY
jgi:outer membrane immunogenic protein